MASSLTILPFLISTRFCELCVNKNKKKKLEIKISINFKQIIMFSKNQDKKKPRISCTPKTQKETPNIIPEDELESFSMIMFHLLLVEKRRQ